MTTRVLPGHGGELTVGYAEKHFNGWAAAGPDGVSGAGGVAGLGGGADDPDE